jgi:hypothetical protein
VVLFLIVGNECCNEGWVAFVDCCNYGGWVAFVDCCNECITKLQRRFQGC